MIRRVFGAALAALPFGMADSVAADQAAFRAAPPPPSVAPLLAALEAEDFVARDEAPAFDRFALLAASLDAAVLRDREGLAIIEAIEANPKAHGRTHGLEWAYEQLFQDATRLRQTAALLRALARHEPAVRALIAADEARA